MSSSSPLVWFVTGINSGFGYELGLIARAAGHTVVGTARSSSKFPSELVFAGVDCIELGFPVSDAAAQDAVSKTISKHGRIDVLVNNAGYSHLSMIEEATNDEVVQQYAINVLSPLTLLRATLPHMRERRSGTVINISSVGGLLSMPGGGVYCSSKFALEGLTEALAGELQPFDIRVHIVEPGYFRTNFLGVQGGGSDGHAVRIKDAYPKSAKDLYAPYHNNQPGDPKKGMQRLFEFVTDTGVCKGMEKQLRLPLGSDCLQLLDERMKGFHANIDAMRGIAKSTDIQE